MPIHIEYHGDSTFIHIKGHGVITDDEYRRHLENLYDAEKKASHRWYVLADLSQVERMDVSFDTVREVSAGNVRTIKTGSHGIVIAAVAPGVMTFGLAQKWEANLEETGWRTKIFTDPEEAEQWLKEQRESTRSSGGLSTRFLSPGLEAEFRQTGLKSDTRVVTGLMLLSVLFQILSLPTDLMLLANSSRLYLVWGIRGASAAMAVVCLLLLRRSKVSFFDTLVFLWAILLMGGIVLANAMLPANYTTHVAWDLFLVLAVYTVVPLPLKRQMIAAFFMTAGDIVLFSQYKVLIWSVTTLDIIAAFICANVVGIFASREMHRWRRREFRTLRREADTRNHLEKAWREIRTLRGIIPICANCKRVRTDEGLWRQVEAYVRDHTEANFSHGICPECRKELYPELDEP